MRPEGEPYGALRDGALAVRDGRIAWLGSRSELPGTPTALSREVRYADGAWMTPGLIDCHTHLIFGGERSGEFELRLQGATYEQIARAGGGILSTVRTTRQASEEDLLESARRRIQCLRAEGVTTVEVKSGYGLTVESEVRMLRVARRLGREEPLDIQTTFLGAHAVPPGWDGRSAAYVDLIVEEMLPRVVEEGLADAADAFLEDIAFTADQVSRVLSAAREMGLATRLHADQLEDGGGAALAAGLGARSADHLEYTSEQGAAAMAAAGTVAVLLPGAFYTLRQTRRPPVRAFRGLGVPMAVATDSNPGSSPLLSLLLAMNMACVLFGLTAEEALAGATVHAARALGVLEDRGTLDVGKRADLALWDIGRPAELVYWLGGSPLREVVKDGRTTGPPVPPGGPAQP
jgi:imidazolonepropionase